jgi:hypothetical protein
MIYPEEKNLRIGIRRDPGTCLGAKKSRKILCTS